MRKFLVALAAVAAIIACSRLEKSHPVAVPRQVFDGERAVERAGASRPPGMGEYRGTWP